MEEGSFPAASSSCLVVFLLTKLLLNLEAVAISEDSVESFGEDSVKISGSESLPSATKAKQANAISTRITLNLVNMVVVLCLAVCIEVLCAVLVLASE